MKKLIGYKEFTSKKGNVCRMITVLEPYHSVSDKLMGERAEDIFVPDTCTHVFTAKDIGKNVDVSYDIQGSFARVSDIKVL